MKKILYFLTPFANISPFDTTIAADAGFEVIIPITNVNPKEVTAIVQDSIFCRPPGRFNDTGIFIGCRDVHMAFDMFNSAKSAMVGPFQAGVFTDPNGAYTTSSSILALVDQVLGEHFNTDLKGRKVAVFGSGPVGIGAALLAAQQGAEVKVCQLLADDDQAAAKRFWERYQVNVDWVSGQTNKEKTNEIAEAEVIICAAKAGIRILEGHLNCAKKLMVVADTNAVPPSGVLGVNSGDLGVAVDYALGSFRSIGPMAIGKIKYKAQFGLYKEMQQSSKAALIDLPQVSDFTLSLLKPQEKSQ